MKESNMLERIHARQLNQALGYDQKTGPFSSPEDSRMAARARGAGERKKPSAGDKSSREKLRA